MKGIKQILLILLAFMYGCIDPIELDISEEKRILVVEGFISTGSGPHRIKLSKSGIFAAGLIAPEVNANVWIRDNDGNITNLEEQSRPGLYLTPRGWSAELNKTYTLNIITSNGTRYTSTPETMTPVAPIDSLITRFKKIPTANPATFISGIEVFARFLDPSDSRDFYLWRNNGTFLIETFPSQFTIRNPSNPGVRIPAPKDCCKVCWINEPDADISVKILDDKNSNGNINTELVAFIPDNGLRFFSKYIAVIHQQSISSEAHAFFDLLKKQLSIEGDIFDPPPATIRGNMINLDKQEENVIGYFYVSDVSIDTVHIDRSFLDELQIAQQIDDDCRVLPFSTTTKPDFWK